MSSELYCHWHDFVTIAFVESEANTVDLVHRENAAELLGLRYVTS